MSASTASFARDPSLLPIALRDTALTVSDLADAGEQAPGWAEHLHGDCGDQIARLQDELRERGLSPDQIDDAAYAQCALLDEVALRSLFGDARDEWERQPLQLTHFGTNDAEELLRRIELRLRDARTAPIVFAIFAAVLDLGFTGRLALDGDAARDRLRRAIDDRLRSARHAPASPSDDDGNIVIEAKQVRPWTQRISAGGCIAIACIALGVAWFAINGWLDASVARMTH